MTEREAGTKPRRRTLRRSLLAMVLVIVATASVGSTLAQEEPFVERVLTTVALMPEDYLPALVDLMAYLNEPEAEFTTFQIYPEMVFETPLQAFHSAPREFLRAQGFVDVVIDFPWTAFQVSALDFTVDPGSEAPPWFGVAEPLEDLVPNPKGIGVFYPNVGIFIQEAHEPGEGAFGARTPIEQAEDIVALTARLSGDTLERLRAIMKELNSMDPEDPERLEFLANPREFNLRRGLTLPGSIYRIVAVDVERGLAVGGVHSSEVRAGLAIVPEGIGIFGANSGVFLQLAI